MTDKPTPEKSPEARGRDMLYLMLGVVLVGGIAVTLLAEVALALWLVRWMIGALPE